MRGLSYLEMCDFGNGRGAGIEEMDAACESDTDEIGLETVNEDALLVGNPLELSPDGETALKATDGPSNKL